MFRNRKSAFKQRLFWLLVVGLASSLASANSIRAQDLMITQVQMEVFDLVNLEREKANAGKAINDPTRLRPFVPNAKLFAAALGHAKNMAAQEKMKHILDGKTPSDRAKELGYPNFVAENIAGGQNSPQQVVTDWMNSPPHRGAILHNADTEIGVGHARNPRAQVWVLNFGRSVEAASPPRLVVAGQTTNTSVSETQPGQQNPPPQQSELIQVVYVNFTGDFATVYRIGLDGKLVSTDKLASGTAQSFMLLAGERSLVQHATGVVLQNEVMQKAVHGKQYLFNADSLGPRQTMQPPVVTQSSVLRINAFQQSLFDEINRVRRSAELAALKPNAKLFTAANNHALRMAQLEQMNHVLDGQTPTDRAKALGYPSNVDEVFNGGANSANRVVSDWLGVASLRAKILSPSFEEIGIGFATSRDTTKVWNIKLGASQEASHPPQLQLQ